MDFRPIFLILGALLTILSVSMTIPAVIDAYMNNPDWIPFIQSSFVTGFVGISLVLTNKGMETRNINIKQAFIMTTLVWVVLAAFATLPLMFSKLNLSFTDAYFEVISGLTTTGGTVISGLDNAPPGVLLWRSILQALGGVGIIVIAMAVLPMLKIGGMQLFRTESSDKSEKVLPKVTQVASAISGVYLILTFLCAFSYWLAGMTLFDAICHSFSTISTGGFSTHDASFLYFNNAVIDYISTLFMFLGGMPFVLFVVVLKGKVSALWKDSQVQWYFWITAVFVVSVWLWLLLKSEFSPEDSFRYTLFNIVSVITTTGFINADYNMWGTFAVSAFFFLMAVGACTGSTAGGIKIFRFQILYKIANNQVNQLMQPHGVFKPQYNGKIIAESTANSVLSFFILFAFIFSVIAALISLTGVDFITSMSATISAMSNVGPGLGNLVGPVGNYSTMHDFAKWMLTAAMLIGRLEIFTVLILFAPRFWRD